MIRKLVALAAGCAAACLASTALAATTGVQTLTNGGLSTPLQITASNPFSITTYGVGPNTTCFTVVRSQDGTNYAPLARDAAGNLATYCGPITVDLTEARGGTYYAIQAPVGTPSFTYRIDQ